MPKKQNKLTPEEQSERFRTAVSDMVAAGDLDPEEAGKALDDMTRKSTSSSPSSDD